jgi:hypothetical protein
MKESFVIAGIETGKLNAMVKNIMRQMGIDNPEEAIKRVNSGRWHVCPSNRFWREENGVIYFSVNHNKEANYRGWIERLIRKEFAVENRVETMLSMVNMPLDEVSKVAILKGELFTDDERCFEKIYTEAHRCGLIKPSAMISCPIREALAKEDMKAMGLRRIVIMQPIDGRLLCIHQEINASWLATCQYNTGFMWSKDTGFAFVS